MTRLPYRFFTLDVFLASLTVSVIYFSWWLRPGQSDHMVLFNLLFLGEIYHLIMAWTFWYTIRPASQAVPPDEAALSESFRTYALPTIDIYITVCGEPEDLVRENILAAKKLNYPRLNIYVLNDGRVAKKDNWPEIDKLTRSLGARPLTRTIPGGAKSGNINHALNQTSGDLIAVFDADMIPHPDFLEHTVPYFADPQVGFVQTPQYYKNFELNQITSGSWDQQQFFFGPIMAGKSRDNAAFICGTNVVIRRSTLLEVGGMEENNIAEDFATSIYIHRKKWRSVYLTEILSAGLAPFDLESYVKQQFRWARGSLQVLLFQNPLLARGLTLPQRIHYLSSGMYYLNGLIILIDILMPLLYLFFGLQPVSVSTTSFAVYFLPYMFLSLYTLQYVSAGRLTIEAFSFSYSSWWLQLSAFFSVLLGIKIGFVVTRKSAAAAPVLPYIYPHLVYIGLLTIGAGVAIFREGFTASVLTNIAWGTFSVILFIPFLMAAYDR